MELYIPSRKNFEKLLSQHGGTIDRYIFSQSGDGLANWFSKIYRYAKPLVRGAIKTIEPELRSLGTKIVDAGTKRVISKIEDIGNTTKQRIKRKKDNLDLQ